MSQAETVEYLLSLREQGVKVVAISKQYQVPRSTLYYWLSRYEAHHTFETLSVPRGHPPHQKKQKVTEAIKTA